MESLEKITYEPRLRKYTGSINAVLIMGKLEKSFKEKGKVFYKFLEPCGHTYYQKGSSWIEELQMTTTEFRTAFKHIAVVYKSKKDYKMSSDKFQGKMYLSYYDRINKLTYYMRNDDLVDQVLDEVKQEKKDEVIREPEQKADNSKRAYAIQVKDEILNSTSEESLDGSINNKTNIKKTNTNLNTDIKTKTNTNINTNTDIKTKTNLDTDIELSAQVDIKSNPDEKVPYAEIQGLFNQICKSHKPIISWSGWQKGQLEHLWEQYGKTIEIFREAFEKIETSNFLSGRIKNWKAQLGWIFKPCHFADILQGKYQNFQKPADSKKVARTEMLTHDWDFDEIERLERQRIDRILESRVQGCMAI